MFSDAETLILALTQIKFDLSQMDELIRRAPEDLVGVTRNRNWDFRG